MDMTKNLSKMKDEHKIIFAVLIAFAVVSFWRGVWGLLDIYLLPENQELSFWISGFMGLSILVFTHYATKELI